MASKYTDEDIQKLFDIDKERRNKSTKHLSQSFGPTNFEAKTSKEDFLAAIVEYLADCDFVVASIDYDWQEFECWKERIEEETDKEVIQRLRKQLQAKDRKEAKQLKREIWELEELERLRNRYETLKEKHGK